MRSKYHRFFVFCFCATFAACFSTAGLADALSSHSGDKEKSFLERYTHNSAQDVLLKALELVGIGYRIGGVNPDSGLDCSSYVQIVYREAVGLALPRTAREQSLQGKKISPSELKPGDLVFFNTMRRAFSHVGIYLGDHYFLHSPSTGGSVRLENMQNSYWAKRYNGARRIIGE
jgi:cell wall-associated NlpC family hydrolase